MANSLKTGLLTLLLLAGCSSSMNRGLYEGIKSQNDGYSTPTERLTSTPSPSYDVYTKDRDKLKQRDPEAEKSESPNFNLK